MTDLYDEVDAAGLPPIRKQAELADTTFAILDLERREGTASEDREARDFYVADVYTGDGESAKHYLAGVAVMDKLDVVARRVADLPVVFKLIKKRTGRGAMYDLVRPDPAEAKKLLRELQKQQLQEVAS